MDHAYESVVAVIVNESVNRGKNVKQYLALLRCFVGYMDSGWSYLPLKGIKKLLRVLIEIINDAGNKAEDRKIWRTAVHVLDESVPAWAHDQESAEEVVRALLKQGTLNDVGKRYTIYRVLGDWIQTGMVRRQMEHGQRVMRLSSVGGDQGQPSLRMSRITLPQECVSSMSGRLFDEMKVARFPVKPKAKLLSFGNREKVDYENNVANLSAIMSGLRRGGCTNKHQAGRIMASFDTIQECCGGRNLNLARHAWALAVMIAPYFPKYVGMAILGFLPKISQAGHKSNTASSSASSTPLASSTSNHDRQPRSVTDSPMETDMLCCLSAMQAVRLVLANHEGADPPLSEDLQRDLFENTLGVATTTTELRVFHEALRCLVGAPEVSSPSSKVVLDKKDLGDGGGPDTHPVLRTLPVARVWQLSDKMRGNRHDVGQQLSERLIGHLRDYIGVFASAASTVLAGARNRHSRRGSTNRETEEQMKLSSGGLHALLRASRDMAIFVSQSPSRPSGGSSANQRSATTSTSTASDGKASSLLDLDFFQELSQTTPTTSSITSALGLSSLGANVDKSSVESLRGVVDILFTLLLEIDESSESLESFRPQETPYLLHIRVAILKALIWLLPASSSAQKMTSSSFFPLTFAGTTQSTDASGTDEKWALWVEHVNEIFEQLTEIGAHPSGDQKVGGGPTMSVVILPDVTSVQTAGRALVRDIAEELVHLLMQRFKMCSPCAPAVLARMTVHIAESAVKLSPHHETTALLTDVWSTLTDVLEEENGVTGARKATDTAVLVQESLLGVVEGRLVPAQSAVDYLDRYHYSSMYRAHMDGSGVEGGRAMEEDDSDDEVDVATVDGRSQVAGTVDASVTGSLAASRITLQSMRNSGARSVVSRQSSTSDASAMGMGGAPGIGDGSGAGSAVLQGLGSRSLDTVKLSCQFSPREPWTNSLEMLTQNALWLAVTHAAKGTFGGSPRPWTALMTLLADSRMTSLGLRSCALAASAEMAQYLRDHAAVVSVAPVSSSMRPQSPTPLPNLDAALLENLAAAVESAQVGILDVVSVQTALEMASLDSSSSQNTFSTSSAFPLPSHALTSKQSTLSMEEVLGLAGRSRPQSYTSDVFSATPTIAAAGPPNLFAPSGLAATTSQPRVGEFDNILGLF